MLLLHITADNLGLVLLMSALLMVLAFRVGFILGRRHGREREEERGS